MLLLLTYPRITQPVSGETGVYTQTALQWAEETKAPDGERPGPSKTAFGDTREVSRCGQEGLESDRPGLRMTESGMVSQPPAPRKALQGAFVLDLESSPGTRLLPC